MDLTEGETGKERKKCAFNIKKVKERYGIHCVKRASNNTSQLCSIGKREREKERKRERERERERAEKREREQNETTFSVK